MSVSTPRSTCRQEIIAWFTRWARGNYVEINKAALARELGRAPSTVRRAIKALIADGTIIHMRGRPWRPGGPPDPDMYCLSAPQPTAPALNRTGPAMPETPHDIPSEQPPAQAFRRAAERFHRQGEAVWKGRADFAPTVLLWSPAGASAVIVLAGPHPEAAGPGVQAEARAHRAVAAALTFQTAVDLGRILRRGEGQDPREAALPGQDPAAHPVLCTVATWPGAAEAVVLSLVREQPDRQVARLGGFPYIPTAVEHCAAWLAQALASAETAP